MDIKNIESGDLPAMPVKGNCVDASGAYCGDVVYSAGLTKRELFAAMAMQSLIKIYWENSNMYDSASRLLNCMAESSVEHADALLAELERAKQGGAE